MRAVLDSLDVTQEIRHLSRGGHEVRDVVNTCALGKDKIGGQACAQL